MRSAELKQLLLRLSADVRAGRYEADMDLGKSEHLGESQELAAAYEARAGPILEACLTRGLITGDELPSYGAVGSDRQVHADRIQTLAECLLVE